MPDFQFLQNPISKKWVILAPRRAKRPNVAQGTEPICPFCLGREGDEKELYRVPPGSDTEKWLVRVLSNKYPFAQIHEIVIHSPEHNKNFDELPLDQVKLILETYRHRYNEHAHAGQVYIFHNRGEKAGESLPHPHSQIAVVPFEVRLDIPRLDSSASALVAAKPARMNYELRIKNQEETNHNSLFSPRGEASMIHDSKINKDSKGLEEKNDIETVQTSNFYIFCPQTSQWPDEVWVAPKRRGRAFGEITDVELPDLAKTLQRLIQIFDLRHGHDFPFNFYIYPGGDWYLRIIPRVKVMGGFEVGTGVMINTQDPKETMAFIKEHFEHPDVEKIASEHRAMYQERV